MPVFKTTITADCRSGMRKGMESWMKNCVDCIKAVTGLEITFETVASLYGSTGFNVDITIKSSLAVRFGVMMSSVLNASNYLSGILCKNGFFPLNGYGNHFDCSAFYSSDLTVIYGDELLYVTVTLSDGEEKTLFFVNTQTEIATGEKYAGCMGLSVNKDGNAVFSGILRNEFSHDGVHVLIRKAETLNGRFLLDNLYTAGRSDNPLPEKKPFDVLFDDGTVKKAIVTGFNGISDTYGRTVCSGSFLCFI